jgi:hypothetical protein
MTGDKRTKKSVNYTPRATNMHERCKLCEHFSSFRLVYGECTKVRGSISPRGWCELFKRASKA